MIGALILGKQHETRFTGEGEWRKVQKVLLQATTKLTVEDARAQWTTHDNLNQWFDNAKQDLIKTGLVIDDEVLDEEGAMLSEVEFRNGTERQIKKYGRNSPQPKYHRGQRRAACSVVS